MKFLSLRRRQVILVGSIFGAVLTIITQSLEPLSSFLYPLVGTIAFPPNISNLLIGDPAEVLFVHLTIPIFIGSICGSLTKEKAWVNGLLCGLLAGLINLIISFSQLAQLRAFFGLSITSTLQLRLQDQFIFFVIMLNVSWSLLAAFSARAAAWSLENRGQTD